MVIFMNIFDIVLIVLIVAVLVGAFAICLRNRKKGKGISGCCDCSNCNKNCNKSEDKKAVKISSDKFKNN